MPRSVQTTIRCPACGQPFDAVVLTLLDAVQDPGGKVQLLSGRLNTAQCPHCRNAVALATPLMYHDSGKELLIAYVPMELNLPKDEQEKLIGEMLRELTASLPKDGFKGYMFNPRRALTMQGLIDQVLEADGVTPEMMQKQRARVTLVQTLVETPEEDLPVLVQEHDAEIDAQFFQTFTLMAQRLAQDGRHDLAEQVLSVQQQVAELSTYGQQVLAQQAAQEEVVREVAEAIQALGEKAQRSDFLDLVLRFADSDQHLQALIGLMRPAFDYRFFEEFTAYVGQAPAEERDWLETLRDRVLELTKVIDQQAQLALQQSVGLLQAIVNSPTPDELIRANLLLVDDTFMAVLAANIQQAERQKDVKATTRLKDIYSRVMSILQENMQPELRFVNELLATESDEEAQTLIAQHGKDYGPQLLDVMDGVSRVLSDQGQEDMVARLAFLRQQAAEMLD